MDILALLQPLNSQLTGTMMRQMSTIIQAMLAMAGRVTMLNISRWAGAGGSYRTIQRFLHSKIAWDKISWLFFRQYFLWAKEEYILAGDGVMVSKAGKHTFGLDRFFSSLVQRAMPGLEFLVFSLVAIMEKHSYPLMMEQVVRTDEEKAAARSKAEKRKKKPEHSTPAKRGRPKGSKNKNKQAVTLNPELQQLKKMLETLLAMIGEWLTIRYLALDGHYGHNAAMQMTLSCGLHLISKLRNDAGLYIRYVGSDKRKKYGDKIDYHNLPDRFLQNCTVEDDIETRIYQAELLNKEFAQALNVVIIAKTKLSTQSCAHVVLFSSDLSLSAEKIIAFYGLRFQIEFNFRDAKQFWGLEDFMTVSQTAVSNSANLSLFMVNLTYLLLKPARQSDPLFSVLDLKAQSRGYLYMNEMIKILPQKPDEFLISQLFAKVAALGRIHAPETAPVLI
jgi:hypothetical protein